MRPILFSTVLLLSCGIFSTAAFADAPPENPALIHTGESSLQIETPLSEYVPDITASGGASASGESPVPLKDTSGEKAHSFSTSQSILEFLNPLWTPPEEPDFHFTFTIPLYNSGTLNFIPKGKIFLSEVNSDIELQNIGVIGKNQGPFGEMLVSYLLINESEESIPSHEQKEFIIDWQGFGDQYIEEGKPIIIFKTPAQYYGENDTTFSFWEKLVLEPVIHHYIATLELRYQDIFSGETISKIQSFPVSVPYYAIKRTLNMGLLLIIAITLGLLGGFLFAGKNHKPCPPPAPTKENEALTHTVNTLLEQAQKAQNKQNLQKKKKSVRTTSGKSTTQKKTPVKKAPTSPAKKGVKKTPTTPSKTVTTKKPANLQKSTPNRTSQPAKKTSERI